MKRHVLRWTCLFLCLASPLGLRPQAVSYPHLILGTDRMGRAFAVRVMMGTRVSLSVGLLASVLVLLLGATYGAISAFAGGWVDNIMMRITCLLYTSANASDLGAPEGTRTPDILIRSQTLYPAELPAHILLALDVYKRQS